jgi:hypothetical protein
MRCDLVGHPLLKAWIAHAHLLICVARCIPTIIRAGAAYQSKEKLRINYTTYKPHFLQWCFLLRIENLDEHTVHCWLLSLGSQWILLLAIKSSCVGVRLRRAPAILLDGRRNRLDLWVVRRLALWVERCDYCKEKLLLFSVSKIWGVT